MYCRIMLMGAPPQDAAKYEGDQSAPCQYFLAMSGRWRLKTRLEAPLRLFTSAETASLGGYSTSRCTWSRSPSISTIVASNLAQMALKMPFNVSRAGLSNTRRRYLATKTKCTCKLNTQCLPCRISWYSVIDQIIMQHVKRLQADRFELMPNGEQQRKMRQFAGSARYVFNRALAIQNQERESTGRKRSSYAALCRMLTGWRNDPQTAWLAEAPVHTTQQALRNLASAWSRHFESLGKRTLGQIKPEEVVVPPQFKKKHRCRESFRYPDAKQFRIEQNNNRLFLPKLGWLRYRNS